MNTKAVILEDNQLVKDELSAEFITEKLKERGIFLVVQEEKTVNSTKNV